MKMTYDKTTHGRINELWREDTQHRDSGGYNLITEGLPVGGYVLKGSPLMVDTKSRTAKVLRRARVLNAVDTKVQVEKHSLVMVGDTIGGQDVQSIDTSNGAYDELTMAAAVTIEENTVVVLGDDAGSKANRLSYSPVKIETGATIDAINFADEVEEDKLALTEEDKTNLTCRFLFI